MLAEIESGLRAGNAPDVGPGWPMDTGLPSRGRLMDPACITVLVGDCEDWAPSLAGLSRLLDPREQARIDRLLRPDDRRRRTIAYGLHRLVLGRAMGREPRDVPLFRDAKGCPRVERAALSTSLSHAGNLIAIAVARNGPVGVDIEPLERAAGMTGIAGRICHDGDRPSLEGLEGEALGQALLQTWVRKEAALKAAGIGLEVEMDTFAASDRSVVHVPGARASRVWTLHADGRFVAAVAGTPTHRVELREWACRPGPDGPSRGRMDITHGSLRNAAGEGL